MALTIVDAESVNPEDIRIARLSNEVDFVQRLKKEVEYNLRKIESGVNAIQLGIAMDSVNIRNSKAMVSHFIEGLYRANVALNRELDGLGKKIDKFEMGVE